VRVFGSRVQGRAKPWSDLDIALMDSKPIEAAVMRSIREAFEESELSFRVDVVDWHTISKEFRDVISNSYEILGHYTSDARNGAS